MPPLVEKWTLFACLRMANAVEAHVLAHGAREGPTDSIPNPALGAEALPWAPTRRGLGAWRSDTGALALLCAHIAGCRVMQRSQHKLELSAQRPHLLRLELASDVA